MHPGGLHGWAPGQPTAVIDLGEEFAPDPSNASSAALQFSAAYYSIDSSAERNGSKKRKVERACDFCRRRKARCDGPRMPDNVCSNCVTNARTCTYLEGSKPRGPPKAYVVGLEDRVEKMEALLKRLRPEADFAAELGPPVVRDSWKTDPAPPLSSSDKARSDSPQASEGSSHASITQSSVSLTAPLSNRAAWPTTSPATGRTDSTFRPTVGRKMSRGGKTRQPSGHEHSSNSDQDPSSSSLSGSSDTDEAGELSIVRGLKRLTLRGLEPTEATPDRYGDDNQWRFHGKSSSFKLISTARDLKQQHIVENGSTSSDGRQSYSPASVQLPHVPSTIRPEFWTVPPWEKAYEHADDPTVLPDFLLPAFPPPDLSETLIRDYFRYNNNTFPLLHRPTFERQWRDKLHTRNVWFACVCMAIFGVASRWSSDPRVLPDEVADKAPAAGEDNGIWTLAGWKYIAIGTKLHEQRRSVLLPPELFEIQSFALIGQYFRGTVAQQGSWFYLSVGVLKAQDVGAHRRKIYGRTPTVEEELWKRAYWHLVAFDRIGSMLIGRECCTREEDLDLELPLEVDDEYWEHENPDLAFRQPEGRPSIVTGFIHWIKLSHIVAFTLKTLYSANKPDAQLGVASSNEQVVDQLNEALSKWLAELPPHLRWRPDIEDRVFASQAATLYTTYQLVQILIYRPFIRIPRIPRGPHSATSASLRRHAFSQKALAICLSSARAGAYILDVQIHRGMSNITNVVHVSFVCAGVLLIHLWDLIRQYGVQRRVSAPDTRLQMSQEISSVMGEIGDLIARLEEVSPKWELAREMIDELKDALPESPTDDGPSQAGHPSDAEAYLPAYQPIPIARSHHDTSPVYAPQISPLTPPEHYVMQEPPPLAQPVPHAPIPHFAEAHNMPMQMSFDGELPQLWDMDGAPASPPPLPNFSMYMQPPPPQQQFAPNPVHKPPAQMPVYSNQSRSHHHSNPNLSHHPNPNSSYGHVQHSAHNPHAQHRGSYHESPPPHMARQSHPGYADQYQQVPQGYSQEVNRIRANYNPSYLKQEEAPLDDHECLRLRLLEEAQHQRQMAAAGRSVQGHPSQYGGPSNPGRHPSEQWANGANRWS